MAMPRMEANLYHGDDIYVMWKCKGAEVFERPGQTMGDLCNFGTSRSSNRLKSGP